MTSHTHDNPFDALNQTEEIKSASFPADPNSANTVPAEQGAQKSVDSSWDRIPENDKSKLEASAAAKASQANADRVSAQERYNKALDLKEEGKKFVQEHKYDEAINVYGDALNHINPDNFATPPDEDLDKKMSEFRIIILNNISQCNLSLDKVDTAMWFANIVVTQDPENIKALFRIAMCLEKQGKFVEAYDKIKEVIQVHKRKDLALSVEIKDALERIRTKCQGHLDEQKEQEKQLHQRMVTGKQSKDSGSANETNSAAVVKKGLLLLPSAVIAYLIFKKGVRSDFRSYNSRGAAVGLTFALFGSLFTDKLWLRGAFAATACALTGAAYKYRFN